MAYSPQNGNPIASQQTNTGRFGEGIEVVSYQHGQYPEHYNPPPATAGYLPEKADARPSPTINETPRSDSKILGMGKGLFLTVLGLIILVLLGLVIGLGAGLGTRLNETHSTTAVTSPSNSTSSNATSTASALPTSTFSSPASTSTAVLPCPAQNLTLYTANSASTTEFRLYCGFDFSGDEADDLGSVNTVSMESCMDVCASTDQCQGAGWGSTGTVASAYTCYLKTNLTSGHSATAQWGFAINLNTTNSSVVV